MPPIHKARGAVNDSCPQEMSWVGYCRKKFQTQPTFKKPGKFSSHHSCKRKKEEKPQMPQDKMLNIPNYSRRNANLKDTKKSVPTCQNGHPHKSTNNKQGREPGREETPLRGQCEWMLETAPRKDSLLKAETKVSKGLSPWPDIPTPGPVS